MIKGYTPPPVSLGHYTEQAMSKAFDDTGSFFAFSEEQFKEKAKPGVKYVRVAEFSGLISPDGQAKACVIAIGAAVDEAIKRRLADHTRERIIEYELSNYESWYTGDISDAVGALESHGITEAEVLAVYRKERDNHE